MIATDKLREAARRILEGDESREAASDLEAAILDHFLDDERLDDLLYSLSMYSPAEGAPYLDAKELREAISVAMARFANRDAGESLGE